MFAHLLLPFEGKERSEISMTPIRREVRTLVRLAIPVAVAQLASMTLWMVDVVMVGRVGVDALAASSLGRSWIMATVVLGMGLVFGIDPIASQAFGARDRKRLSLSVQTALVVAGAASLPVGLSWLGTQKGLEWLGQEAHLSQLAHDYVLVQLPGLPFFLAFIAIQHWLQGRGIMRPAMWVTFAANGINILANWVLIFGKWGFPALGLLGAGIATSITQIFMPLALLFLVRRYRLGRGGWLGWSREALKLRQIRPMLVYGFPVAMTVGLELWAFALTTVLSGVIGKVELATHTIVVTLASLSFMLPLGISIAAVTRVGNLVGARETEKAKRAAWVAFGLGAGVMVVSAVVFIAGRHTLPLWFGASREVALLSALILPIASAFQIFDGIQVVGAGILRGLGRTRPAVVFNFIAYYVLALPLSCWWIFVHKGGLGGLWWSMCLGLGVVAVLMMLWVWRRWPEDLPQKLTSESSTIGS